MAEKRQTARRRTMGASPLDLYLQPGKATARATTSETTATSKAGKASEAGKASAALGKLTIMAPTELLGRLRSASYWSREPVVDIVRRAVEREVARLEEKHGTEPAPPLRPGRKARL